MQSLVWNDHSLTIRELSTTSPQWLHPNAHPPRHGKDADIPMFVAELCEEAVGLPWVPRRKHPFFCTKKGRTNFSFLSETNSNHNFLKNMNPSVPSMRVPLQLQLRGLPWDSLWLCFSGLRSPLLPGNSLIYFSGKKHMLFTMKIYLRLYCSALLAIRFHSRMWFQRWLAGH